MKKIYPLKLISVNKDIIWGGTTLGEKYNKPAGKTAEAWELAVIRRASAASKTENMRECFCRSISEAKNSR